MPEVIKINRRDFCALSASAGAGLVLGVMVPGCPESRQQPPSPDAGVPPPPYAVMTPNIYVSLDSDGVITIVAPRTEMGQGVRTALPMILAEELDCDWSLVRCEGAVEPGGFPNMQTGGSTSVQSCWDPLRLAGAAARAMLIQAAANTWQVEPASCSTAHGEVIHEPSNRRARYQELIGAAKDLPVPTDVVLKDASQFILIGTEQHRLDSAAKVDGSARFGIDMRVDGMLYAVVARPPTIGGQLSSFDASTALAVEGVRQVLAISTGVAVVADNTWAALQGRAALQVTWDAGPNAGLDDAELRALLDVGAAQQPFVAQRVGDPDAALATASTRLDAIYEVPFLAHAALEPMNCTVQITADSCEIWASTQHPSAALAAARALVGPVLPVNVHVMLAGGGFGGRQRSDNVTEAVELAQQVGAPIQVVWSREDDLRHDCYRPFSRHLLAGGLDANGNLTALSHVVVTPAGWCGRTAQAQSSLVTQGLKNADYAVPNQLVGHVDVATPLPAMFWRSVYLSQNPFASECFLDELAAMAGRDPLQLRHSLLAGQPRLLAVLDLAAERAGWGARPAAGRHRGLACAHAYGSFIALVAEVSVAAGNVLVHKVVAAVDCGQLINPDIVRSQIEAGVVFGLSAALYGEINVDGGAIRQGNYDTYRILKFDQAPVVEVHLVASSEPVGGIGELPIPALAPAVANAVSAATGARVRILPIRVN